MTEGGNCRQENSLPIPSLGQIKDDGRRYLLLSRDPDPALGTPTQGEDLAQEPRSEWETGHTPKCGQRKLTATQDPVLQITQIGEWVGRIVDRPAHLYPCLVHARQDLQSAPLVNRGSRGSYACGKRA